jgi:hypothetical protein
LLHLLDEKVFSDFNFFSIAAASTPASSKAIGTLQQLALQRFLKLLQLLLLLQIKLLM